MKFFHSIILLFITIFTNAQTGINTTAPKATLDVALPSDYQNGNVAGITIPQLTSDQLFVMNTSALKQGTLIYTDGTSATVAPFTKGLYTWTGTSWSKMSANAPNFFYSPALKVDTSFLNGSVDLYENYRKQFATPMVSSAGSSGNIPVYKKTDLEYYITWYDTAVFSSITISADGVMNYTVTNPGSSYGSYINVVFKIKDQ